MKTIEDVVAFLKKAETYYLATDDEGQPRVRPFGTAHLFEGRLYIQTGKSKDVSRQLHANPRCEICAFTGGTWLRIAARAVETRRCSTSRMRRRHSPRSPHLWRKWSSEDYR